MLICLAIGDTDPIRYRSPSPGDQFSGNIIDEEMRLVERFFAESTGRRIRRGVFTSVAELEAAIHDYLDHHNGAPKPFVWTKKASVILEKEARARAKLDASKSGNQASDSEH